MKWKSSNLIQIDWRQPIINKEEKEEVAQKVAQLVSHGDIIGAGSGSTSFLAIQAIANRMKKENISCTVIPTSAEIALTCAALGIPTTTLLQCRPSWSFDGADEVDKEGNLIKGRGGALFKEKIVMVSSPKTYIIVDSSKLVDSLGNKFPIPVEVHQFAIHSVYESLNELGAKDIKLRLAQKKDGPVITENGNFLLDVKFPYIENSLEKRIKAIPGVIESGLFIGYNVNILVTGSH